MNALALFQEWAREISHARIANQHANVFKTRHEGRYLENIVSREVFRTATPSSWEAGGAWSEPLEIGRSREWDYSVDGTGGTYSPTNIATIYNETGLDLATLITNGNLIVHT